MKCLVCEREWSEEGYPCKMCGMRALKPVAYAGFFFCCGKCVGHFENIVMGARDEERRKIIEQDVVL